MSDNDVAAPAAKRGISRIVIATIAILCVVGVAWMFLELARFFLLVFAAVVLAVIFDAMTRQICRIPGLRVRWRALTLSIVVLLLMFIGTFFLFGAQFSRELDTIQENIPRALGSVEALLEQIGLGGSVAQLLEQGKQDVSNLASRIGRYTLAVTSGVADFVLVFVGAIFIAANPGVYRRGLLLLLPHRAERPTAAFLDDGSRALRGWMLGQLVSSVVVAALTWVGLALLGVPASGGLAIIAGLLDVIPMVGPIIAAVPAVLLALTESPATAAWTIGLYLLIQQLQGNVLQPMIQKHAVNVPPAVLLFAVFAAGILFGVVGVLLAAPLTIVTYVFVQRIYVRELLGKPISVAGKNGPDE